VYLGSIRLLHSAGEVEQARSEADQAPTILWLSSKQLARVQALLRRGIQKAYNSTIDANREGRCPK
jgi:hypothetical protein